jgi:DNA-binding MarR family transcriptional regulator
MAYRKGGSLVSSVRQLSHRIFRDMLRRHGLGGLHPAQGKILFALMGAPEGLTIGEVAGRTLLKKSTLTNMLRRMEANGYVAMAADAADGRATRVRLTGKFAGESGAFDSVSREMTALWYEGFGEEEIDSFESMLERILGNLIRYESAKMEEEP